MSLRNGRRRSPAGVVVLLALILVAALVALAWLLLTSWQRGQQVRTLQDEVRAYEQERETTSSQLVSLQGTASAMEDRLANLEADDPARQIAALETAVASAGEAQDAQEIAALRTTLGEIQTQVDGFQVTLDDLGSRLQALEAQAAGSGQEQQPLAPEARLVVDRQKQSHNLSCESSAASMVAHYYSLALSEADVQSALPLNANPNLGFRGNVDGPTGGLEDYGVYAGPILAILNARGLQAQRVQGGLDGVKAAIAQGRPVIAWVTYNCTPSTPTTVTVEGKEVTLVPYEHVLVVTGYDAGGVWANDPWDGQEHYYSNAEMVQAMAYFGNMAIEVTRP
jgi:uncharacterized protein YvpB